MQSWDILLSQGDASLGIPAVVCELLQCPEAHLMEPASAGQLVCKPFKLCDMHIILVGNNPTPDVSCMAPDGLNYSLGAGRICTEGQRPRGIP